MDLFFVEPELRRIDEADVELCACGIWSDERPVRGFAGLLDWRLGGRLSALLKSGFVRGDFGESLLLPGKPHLPFEKVLVVGLGPRGAFGDAAFRRSLTQTARALERMRVRRAVVELPGRAGGAIDPEQAVTLTLECLGASADHDAWWLVEDAEAQRRVEQRAAEERRRVRAV
ncbi:MAG TPA: M17 family peptidase N-terminal domain-containing protein [Polyangiaceae bacterium]|nr:M17 family peptidase N-terminal domain-containing protein [Polyangiaceae bacterium]